jgi:alpha-amylase
VTDVVLYFQVHQPFRIRRLTCFDVGQGRPWFDDRENERIARRVARRAYGPATAALLAAVRATKGRFRCAFSISGTALDQLERWAPRALRSFQRLAKTGAVEMLAETSHHSLCGLDDGREFEAQVRAHAERVEATFGRRPRTFRNTELVLDQRVARRAAALGFRVALAEGADRVLRGRSPHAVYRVSGVPDLKVLLRSYRLSDDVAFRFSDRGWSEWPLRADRYASWLAGAPAAGDDGVVGLFMDFETFGEHHRAASGIVAFLAALPEAVLAAGLSFATPEEAAERRAPKGTLRLRRPVSWADEDRDVSAWLGNDLQIEARDAHAALGPAVRRASRAGRTDLLEAWRRLSTSDHLYYMYLRAGSDADVHRYFSPWPTPHDAFLSYLHVLEDLAAHAARAGRRPAARRPLANGGALADGGALAKARGLSPRARQSRRA